MRRKLKKIYKLSRNYGVRCVLSTRVERKIFGLLKNKPHLCEKLFELIHSKKENRILTYSTNVLSGNYDNRPQKLITEDCNIWVFWWTGFDSAPEIVKACVKSMMQHSAGHKIQLLDRNNIKDYVMLPDYIWEKFNKNIISVTHLSDIIRVTLLYTHGGIWADATLFFTDRLNQEIYSHEFYTNKRHEIINPCVSQSRWSTFFLAGGQYCEVFRYWRDFYFEYWKNTDTLVDYLLMDYILDIGYRNYTTIRSLIDSVPYNNENIKLMYQYMNTCFTHEQYEALVETTTLHKLSWKDQYSPLDNGRKTFYEMVISGALNMEKCDE